MDRNSFKLLLGSVMAVVAVGSHSSTCKLSGAIALEENVLLQSSSIICMLNGHIIFNAISNCTSSPSTALCTCDWMSTPLPASSQAAMYVTSCTGSDGTCSAVRVQQASITAGIECTPAGGPSESVTAEDTSLGHGIGGRVPMSGTQAGSRRDPWVQGLLNQAQQTTAGPSHQVGVYYTTLNQPDASYAQNISVLLTGQPNTAPTVEHVLRSNGTLQLADVASKYYDQLNSTWCNADYCNWYQTLPLPGFYCTYRKRSSESFGILPDCPNISQTLEYHAQLLTSAGVDYIVLDGTNFNNVNVTTGDPDANSDVRQMRPTEVLLEEWSGLRSRGIPTPTMIVWTNIDQDPTPGNNQLWQVYLDRIYNNESFSDLLYRDPLTGLRVMMVVWSDAGQVNQTSLAAIQSNGGREDIIVVPNWVAPSGSGQSWYDNGVWTYISECTGNTSDANCTWSNVTVDSTTIPYDGKCGHYYTPRSVLGAEYTVSAATAVDNLPFAAPGKLNGLYLKKQWEDVLDYIQAANYSRDVISDRATAESTDNRQPQPQNRALPPLNHIFAPSFNEWQIWPADMANWNLNNSYFCSMGADDTDPDRFKIFIDGYGDGRSRGLEPTIFDGGRTWSTFASCVRVSRVLAHLAAQGLTAVHDWPGQDSTISGDPAPYHPCPVQGEECCTIDADQMFVHVYSLQLSDNSTGVPTMVASMVTTDRGEVQALVGGPDLIAAAGQVPPGNATWAQVCAPWGIGAGPQSTVFCADGSMPWQPWDNYQVVRGPFLLLANGTAQGALPGAVPIYRCVNTAAGPVPQRFVDSSAGCSGMGTAESLLGYGKTSMDSTFPRPLRRCFRVSTARSGTVKLLDEHRGDDGLAVAEGITATDINEDRKAVTPVVSQAHRREMDAETGRWYHAVGGPCYPGDVEQALVAFVP